MNSKKLVVPSNCVIKVIGINHTTSPEFLKNAYSLYGKIVYVYIPKDNQNQNRSYAYIAFKSPASVQNVIEKGKTLKVFDFQFEVHSFNMAEFQRFDLSPNFDVKASASSKQNAEPEEEIYQPPTHFTTCYTDRPDRADMLLDRDDDFDPSLAKSSIEIEKIQQIYNYGFKGIPRDDGIPESILPKF